MAISIENRNVNWNLRFGLRFERHLEGLRMKQQKKDSMKKKKTK